MADRRRARRLRRIRLVAAVAVCLLVAGGGAAWAMTGSSGKRYRTATAAIASISQTLDSVGVVHAVNKAVVSFPVSGRVATVPVAVGQSVQAGQVLATLDTSSLTQAVQQANQTVAQDQLKLADDETGQVSGTSGPSSSGSARSTTSGSGGASSLLAPDSAATVPLATGTSAPGSGAPSGGAPSGGAPSTGAPSGGSGSSGTGSPANGSSAGKAVAAAQQQLLSDQKALDQILSDAALADLRALVATDGPCAMTPARPTSFVATTDASGTITVTTPGGADVTAGTASVSPPVSTSDGDTVTITGTPSTSYTVTITPTVGSIDAASCTTAIQNAVSSLAGPGDNAWTIAQAITSDELTLSRAITALEHASSAGSSRAAGAGQSGASRPTGAAGSGTTGGSGSGSGGGSGGGTPASPEQLAADQAAVDAAQAELAVAEQNLAQAQIHSPISGTVADVGLSAGSAAGSNAITVIGSGTYDVATTVSLTDLDLMKVGDSAAVRVDGISAPLSGTVATIGVLDSTTGSTTTFPVTVALDPASARLFDGAGADVHVTVAQVNGVLSVPSSAVHSVGVLHTVTVLTGSTAVLTRVGVGAVGTDRTQITSGLKAGQRVVLAELDAPLPGTSSATTGRRAVNGLTGGGGLGGGGLGGAGLGGGGLGGGGTRRGG